MPCKRSPGRWWCGSACAWMLPATSWTPRRNRLRGRSRGTSRDWPRPRRGAGSSNRPTWERTTCRAKRWWNFVSGRRGSKGERALSGGFDFGPEAVPELLGGGGEGRGPDAALEDFGRRVERRIIANGSRQQRLGRGVGRGGPGGFGDGGGDAGAQQVVDEAVRQRLAAAFAQNHGVVQIERKALGGIGESEARGGVDGLLRGGGPHLGHQHVSGDQLAAQFVRVGGAEWQREFAQAGAQHVFGIVQHGEAAFEARIPQVRPSGGGGRDAAAVGDTGGVPHVRYAPFEAG